MNITTKIINEVDYNEVGDEIQKFLTSKGLAGNLYESVPCEQELGNDTTYNVKVTPETPVNYDMDQLKKGKFTYRTRVILDWMCFDGIIPAGEYNINISW